jgi:hypothetical protein
VGVIVLLLLTLPMFGQQPPSVQERLGYEPDARLLIIHADDLGMAHSVNRATFEALEKGWITSASIMVPTPWFAEVARFARSHPAADLGIHLTLNSEWTDYRWGPVSSRDGVSSLLDEDGYFPLVEEPVVENGSPEEIERELRAQIDKAIEAGIRISHLDSHMAVLFRTEPLFAVLRRLSASYDIPMLIEREGSRGGDESEWATASEGALIDRVVSIGPGVAIADWPEAYERLLEPLPPGVYQLIVHLAYSDDEMRGATWNHPDWGAAWRQADLDLVRSERFRSFLKEHDFVLVDWRELARSPGHSALTSRD